MLDHEQRYYSSSELIEAVGCTRKALRVYQDSGLLHPDRSRGNRRYCADAFDRLRFIVSLRSIGLSVDRISALLSIKDGVDKRAAPMANELADQIGQLVPRVTEKIQALLHARNQLVLARETLMACSTCSGPTDNCQRCADAGALDEVAKLLLVHH